MRRLLPALLALLAALVATSWFALDRAPDATGPRVADETSGAVEAADVTESPRRRRVARAVQAAAATPAEQADGASAEPEKSPCVVRVLREGDGTPVHGLRLRTAEVPARTLTTDVDGRASFEPVRPGEPLTVRADAPGMEKLELPPGETVVRVPDPIPLRVQVFDAESGEPLSDAWVGLQDVIDVAGSSVALPAPLWPGHRYRLALDVRVDGVTHCAPPDDELVREGTISRYADAAVVRVAVPRVALVRIVVVDSGGRPVPRAAVAARAAGTVGRGTTGPDGSGFAVGVAFRRGERVRCSAAVDGRSAAAWSEPLSDPAAETVVRLQLPDLPDKSTSIGAGASGRFRTRVSRRNLRSDAPGTGSVVVQVLRRDGRPAPGATVILRGPRAGTATADRVGVARFDGLPEGPYRLLSREHGLLPMDLPFTLDAGEARQITLQEPEGRELHLRVVDAQGRPLPFVRVEVTDAGHEPFVRIERGVQHLDLLSDAAGDVHVRHAPEGPLEITAWYGSREARVTLRDGDPQVVTIPDPPVPDR